MVIRSAHAKNRRQRWKDRKHPVRCLPIMLSKVIAVILLIAFILLMNSPGLAQWQPQVKLKESHTPTENSLPLESSTPKPSVIDAGRAETMNDPFVDDASLDHEARLVPSNADYHDKTPSTELSCLGLRGTNGHWFQDKAFSRRTFYAFGPRSSAWQREGIQQWKRMPNAQARKELQQSRYYKGNQYNWKDTGPAAECPPMEPMSLAPFCKTLQKLQVTRIFFVGDSLMQAQVDSFFRLLSLGAKKKKKNDHRSYPVKNRQKERAIANQRPTRLECPMEIYNQSIRVDFARENMGSNLQPANTLQKNNAKSEERLHYGPEIPFCKGNQLDGDYCPWHLRYNQSATADGARTLLILNQGAHFHSIESFSNTMDHFLLRFQEIAKPRDIVMFRSTVPGHEDCFDHEQQQAIPVVNMTHDLFLERYATSKYDWNLFDLYNQYAAKILEEQLPKSVRFHYLNVYNMTVLRPDEHVSDKDCLHYTHPGPIDFWNHLLATNLRDMSIELMEISED